MATNNVNDFTNPVSVDTGGTSVSSTTAYAVQCAGTTSTNPIQSIASVGLAGQLLTSNDASHLPTFQGSVSSSPLVLIQSQLYNNGSGPGPYTISFTTGITNTYNTYLLLVHNVSNYSANQTLSLVFSNNGGASYVSSGYAGSVQGYGAGTSTNYPAGPFIPLNIVETLGGLGNFYTCSAYVWLFNMTSGANASTVGWSQWITRGINHGPSFIAYQSSVANVNALQLAGGAATSSPPGIVSLFGLVE